MMELDFSVVLSAEFRSWLIGGLVLSLQLTFITLLLALPLGIAVALMRLSTLAALRWLGFAFVEGIRNIPLLVHMLFWYFGATALLPEAARAWLYEHNAESVCAVIALTFYTAAYMAEDVRSGIRTIPATQTEAARALGLGAAETWRRIVLPQALRASVPPLVSQTVSLWKNTSIATVIGAAELMYQAQRVETASFRGVETFAVATLAYLSVSLIITALSIAYQRRYPVRPA